MTPSSLPSIRKTQNAVYCMPCSNLSSTISMVCGVRDSSQSNQKNQQKKKRGRFIMLSLLALTLLMLVILIFKGMTVTLVTLRLSTHGKNNDGANSAKTLWKLWMKGNIWSAMSSSFSTVFANIWYISHPIPTVALSSSSGTTSTHRQSNSRSSDSSNSGLLGEWPAFMQPSSIQPLSCQLITHITNHTQSTTNNIHATHSHLSSNKHFNASNSHYLRDPTHYKGSVKTRRTQDIRNIGDSSGGECDENVPLFYNIQTNGKVYYDGGQWFHMAENLLIHFSTLRRNHRLISSNESASSGKNPTPGVTAYYNFDQGKIYLGIIFSCL